MLPVIQVREPHGLTCQATTTQPPWWVVQLLPVLDQPVTSHSTAPVHSMRPLSVTNTIKPTLAKLSWQPSESMPVLGLRVLILTVEYLAQTPALETLTLTYTTMFRTIYKYITVQTRSVDSVTMCQSLQTPGSLLL